MENLRKRYLWINIGDDARRQFIDAQAVFTAWEDAAKSAAEVRGGMYLEAPGNNESGRIVTEQR